MNPNAPVFLSASVPDPLRAQRYAETADSVAIASAVGALVHVLLGRRKLIWGGHPAITPMVYSVAEGLGMDYSQWVTLYQSEYFQDRYPEDNEKFKNIIFTPREVTREQSLSVMRHRMLGDNAFGAGVFIGGMEGIVDEFHLFREMKPEAFILPITSTGGAVREIAAEMPNLPPDFDADLDYVALFHRHLGIPASEKRYARPSEQPTDLRQRLLKASDMHRAD